jgi:superfamily II DNA or RNA helicase
MKNESQRYIEAFKDELPKYLKGIPHADSGRKGIVFESHQCDQMQGVYRRTVQAVNENRQKLAMSIVATCGSGKTLTEMAVVLASQDAQRRMGNDSKRKDMIITSGRAEAIGIRDQYASLGYQTGRLGGGEKETEPSILVANIQALQAFIAQEIFEDLVSKGSINVGVLDEADLHLTAKRKEVQQHLGSRVLFGGTATDEWPDGRNIRELFGEPVHRLDLMNGIRQRINAKPLFRAYESEIDGSKLRIKKNDYDPVVLSGAMKAAEIHKSILEVYRDIVPEGEERNMPTLIYVPSVPLVRKVTETMQAALGNDLMVMGWVGGEMDANALQASMDLFKEGEVNVVVMCEMGGRGMNLENAQFLIDAYPTLSLNKLEQRDGRVLRKIRQGSALWNKGWRKQNAVIAQILPRSNRFRPAIFTDLLGGREPYLRLLRELGGGEGGAPIIDEIDKLREYIERKKPLHHVHFLGEMEVYERIRQWDELPQADRTGYFYIPRTHEEADEQRN